MKLIYIAGKYTGVTYAEVEKNIIDARRAAIDLLSKKWEKGFFPVTPHLNTAHFESMREIVFCNIDYDFWLKGTKEILKRCDGILLLENWIYSSGAIEEKKYAEKLGIPIYYSIDEIK